ncbi:MAG: YncE family protein [Gemmatimonadota bacterium]
MPGRHSIRGGAAPQRPRSPHRLAVAGSLLAGVLVQCGGCDKAGPLAPPDTGSPQIAVVFPSAVAYDRDGDGLLDLEFGFRDSLTGIDPASFTLTSDRPLKGAAPVPAGATLLAHWDITRRDSLGLVMEERVAALLPRGRVVLTVGATDRAGNRAVRSFALTLPPAARHMAIDIQATLRLSTALLVTPDGRRLYVTTEEAGGSALSIVDPQTLTWLRTVRTPLRGLSRMAFDPRRNRIYAMSIDHPQLGVFDVASETFLAPIPTTFRGIGLALSPRRDELFIGLEIGGLTNGFVDVIDLARGAQARLFSLGLPIVINPDIAAGMQALAFDPGETRLFAVTSAFAQQGLLVIDPDTGAVLEQVDLRPETPGRFGGARDLAIDQGRLLATSTSSLGVGRVVVTTVTAPSVLRFGVVGPFRDPVAIAVAPDGRDWALTIVDGQGGIHAVGLMDATTLDMLWEAPLDPASDIRHDIAFRPDGNVFFAVGGRFNRDGPPPPNELTVYLHR